MITTWIYFLSPRSKNSALIYTCGGLQTTIIHGLIPRNRKIENHLKSGNENTILRLKYFMSIIEKM